MKGVPCLLTTALLLFISLLLAYNVWITINHELDVYSRVQAQREAITRTFSSCKPFKERSDIKFKLTGRSPEVSKRGMEKCSFGSVLRNGQCNSCPEETFSLPGWISCKKHLVCDQIEHDVRIINSLFDIGRWNFKMAEWSGYQSIHASIKTEDTLPTIIEPDIVSEILRNSSLLYPIGFCTETKAIVYVKPSLSRIRGPANKLDTLFAHHVDCDNWIVRFRLAIDFVRMLAWLHSTPGGPVVFCNSFNLEHTFQQLAITENWELTLGTFDNLKQVKTGSLIKCSDKEIEGNFVAPEQRWPYRGLKVFNIQQQPSYSESTDVWKIPDVTESLLGSLKMEGQRSPLIYLSGTHSKCKNVDPGSRPSATQVLQKYMEVWTFLAAP